METPGSNRKNGRTKKKFVYTSATFHKREMVGKNEKKKKKKWGGKEINFSIHPLVILYDYKTLLATTPSLQHIS